MSLLGLTAPVLLVVRLLAAQATPATPTSGMPPVVWQFEGYTATNGEPREITDPSRYTLQFLPGGRLVARLDCNQGSGSYIANNGTLTLTPMAATLKLCPPDSQADAFGLLLSRATTYRFDPDGSLLLRGDAGVLQFQPTLTGVVWQWQGNVDNDGHVTRRPDVPEHYAIEFVPDGTVAILADCNSAAGRYSVTGSTIDVEIGGVTRMACPPGSLMTPFLDDVGQVVSHSIQQGALALALPEGGGLMVFAPVVASATATPAAG